MCLPNISIVPSVRYGNYKAFLNNALYCIDILEGSFHAIKQYISLPRNLDIVFRPVRDAYGRAFYTTPKPFSASKQYIVELDVRQDPVTFKDTLIHELVHIEQFYQKRLVDAGPMHFKWKGEKMLVDQSTIEAYNDLPWEIEANNRSKRINAIIFKDND